MQLRHALDSATVQALYEHPVDLTGENPIEMHKERFDRYMLQRLELIADTVELETGTRDPDVIKARAAKQLSGTVMAWQARARAINEGRREHYKLMVENGQVAETRNGDKGL